MFGKWILLIVCSWFSAGQLLACDICGSNMSNGGVGLLNPINQNIFSIKWNVLSYKGGGVDGPVYRDRFLEWELTGSYYLTGRLKATLGLPVRWNQRNHPSGRQALSGIGDTRIMLSWQLLKNHALGDSWTLNLEWAAGAKCPTGRFIENIHDRNLPEHFNLGMGSWGLSTQPVLLLEYRNTGFLLSPNVMHFSSSSSGYRFGDQFSLQSLCYWDIPNDSGWNWMPYGGLHYEKIRTDRYASDWPVSGTGGQGLLAVAGINVKHGSWMSGASVAHPVAQEYSGGAADLGTKFSCHISYLFN
ncbi:MAG TPA: hypothetical protein VFX48_02495 [Saprospiraceae bacterium]|nr:hypothetical protein [Saprospiraceae bacterium]